MAASSISPVAPARVGALVVPVGKVKKSKFNSFVGKLQAESVVRLGDISPDQRPDRNLFSPLAFPNGVILYDISTSEVPASQRIYFPFELQRNQLVILGIVDGRSNSVATAAGNEANRGPNDLTSGVISEYQEELEARFPHALSIQILIFDSTATSGPVNVLTVPPKDQMKSTTMKTLMCDVSARLLAEMSLFAKMIQEVDSIPTPTAAGMSAPFLNRYDSIRQACLAKEDSGFARPRLTSPDRQGSSDLEEEQRARRASSPARRPAQEALQSPERSASPATFETSPPNAAASFSVDKKKRPTDSAMSRIRDLSRNRSSVHGMPSRSSSDRGKFSAKLRQGLIVGNLFMMSGRWADALRELVDNTTRAKAFADYIWYAKGMECILTTMILLAWARIDFTVPSICFSAQDRPMSLKHTPSSNLIRSSQSLDSSDNTASHAMSNLQLVLPEIVNTIIQHYRRDDNVDGSGPAQFPFSESVIRLAYLMAVLQRTGGQLNDRTARYLVVGSPGGLSSRLSQHRLGVSTLHNADIAGLIFQAFPPESLAATMVIGEVISIMSGTIAVLSMARLYRKRAMIIREALSLLIPRLIQARKVGAAEAGIHPAASLAARHGLTIDSSSGAPLLDSGKNDIDFHELLVILCETFGVPGLRPITMGNAKMGDVIESKKAQLERQQLQFGGFELKTEILRLVANFSESVPNFHDVVQFTAALLRTAGPGSAPAPASEMMSVQLQPEDQRRFFNKINRTLGVFKSEDAQQLESDYWDSFLVRDVEINGATHAHTVKLSGRLAGVNRIHDSYDYPSPSSEARVATTMISPNYYILAKESTELIVTMQNLYDFEVQVERVQIMTDGVELQAHIPSATLAPRSLQQVICNVSAPVPGQITVSGCRVKIQGCREQLFKVFPNAWKPAGDVKIKSHGLKALIDVNDAVMDPANLPPQPVTKSFDVVAAQPKLLLALSSRTQDAIDILEGESSAISVTVRNAFPHLSVNFLQVAFDYEYDRGQSAIRPKSAINNSRSLKPPIEWQEHASFPPIAPGESRPFKLSVHGQFDLQQATLRLDHGYLDPEHMLNESITLIARRLTITLAFNVQPSIRIEAIYVLPQQQLVAVDIINASPSMLIIEIPTPDPVAPNVTPQSTDPNQSTRILLPITVVAQSIDTPLHVTWRDSSSDRHGSIRIPPSQLSSVLAAAPAAAPAAVTLQLLSNSGSAIVETAYHQFIAPLQAPLTLRCTVSNSSDTIKRFIVDFEARAAGPAVEVLDIDVTRALAWTGNMKQGARLGPGESKDMELGLQVCNSGLFEVTAEVTHFRGKEALCTAKLVFEVE
ncbi:MAG: hypothetical protein Q9162_005607 [Coniocarpon cinnabarinum]